MDNQIATTQTQDLAIKKEIPMEVLKFPGKSPLLPYLPDKLVSSLPETVKVEIQQSKLKWSDDQTLERFANRVILAIDPKFSDGDSDDQFSDFNIAKNKVYDFGRRCDLTEGEYLLALEMAMKGKLVLDEQKVKIYREILHKHLS